MKTFPAKDPDSKLDYAIDWESQLPNNDVISSSTWFVADGITATDAEFESKKTMLWLEGGVSGKFYRVTNRISTAQGRVVDRTFVLPVSDR